MGYNRVLGHFTNSQELAVPWQGPGQLYLTNQIVINSNLLYLSTGDYISTASFANDLAAGYWIGINSGGIIGIAQGGTGQTTATAGFDALAPTTTAGDLIVYNGTDNVRLPVGSNGYALVSDSTAPNKVNWGTVAIASGGTGQTTSTAAFDALAPTTTAGDLIVYNGTDNVRQGIGTDGQVLVVDTSQPNRLKWATAPSGNTNFITNGGAEANNTNGWATYAESDAVTFTDIGDLVSTVSPHGLFNGNQISFTSITSTTGISTNTLYYVISATSTTFQVASSLGGAALPLTTNGAGTMVRFAPKTGSGGAANVSISANGTNPLIGSYSFLLAKGAPNREGQGWSYDFTIDRGYQAKVLQISFNYIIAAANTFVAGTSTTVSDVTVWIYDVTNAVVIQPSSSKLLSNSATVSDTFNATFQTASNSTSYRLIFHVSTPSTTDYTLKVDGITVSPSTYVYGTPVTDWTDRGTMTIGAVTTAPTKGTASVDKVLMRRVGDSAQFLYEYSQTVAGAAGSGTYLFSLPSGMSIDTTKIPITVGGFIRSASYAVGQGNASFDSGNGVNANVTVYPYSSTQVALFVSSSQNTSGTGGTGVDESISSSNYALSDSVASYKFSFTVPISGWSSSVQTSDQTDTRVVAAALTHSAQSISNNIDVQLTGFTVSFDTHGAFSSNQYTIPVSGYYKISGSGKYAVNSVGTRRIYYRIDGGAWVYLDERLTNASVEQYLNGQASLNLRTGQTIQFGVLQNSGGSLNFTGLQFSIERISGPSAIAAVETVTMSAYLNANANVNADAIIIWNTKEFDSHSAYSTTSGQFTAPISGTYEVSTYVYGSNPGTSVGYFIWKNNTKFKIITWQPSGSNTTGYALIKLNAGDTVDIRPDTGAPRVITGGALNTVNCSYMQITKIGNL